jgi:WD40 repeat protein
MLVVICTKNAIDSNFVKDEVERYATLGRKALTVDVKGAFNAVRGQEPWVGLSGTDPEVESQVAISSAHPSENVIERILKMVEFTTQDRRLRQAAWGTLIFVALSVGGTAAVSALIVRAANQKKDAAEQQASKAIDEAKKANESALAATQREADAKATETIAKAKATEAEGQAAAAEKLRISAEAKAGEALEKERNARAEAARQQNIATAGRVAAENILAPEPILEQVEKKVLFTIESIRRAPSNTAYRNLIEGIKMMPNAVARVTHEGAVKNLIFSPDGRYMLTVADDALWLRSTEGLSRDGKLGPARKVSGTEAVKFAKVSPNGKYVAAAGDDRVRLWRGDTMSELQSIEQKGVRAIAFSQDGELLVIGFGKRGDESKVKQKTASVWRFSDGQYSEVASVDAIEPVFDVSFSPDKLLFTTLSDEGLHVWKTNGGQPVLANNNEPDLAGMLRSGGFSPNGKYLFQTGVDERRFGTVLRFDTRRSVFSAQLDFVEFSSDGRFLVTTSSDDETDQRETHVWDAYTEEFKELSRINYNSIIINGEFSRDGKLLALVSLDNQSAEIWDTLSGRLLTYVKLKNARGALAFTPDAKYFAATAGNEVTVWPLSRDWKMAEVRHTEGPTAISGDGRYMAVAGGTTIRLLNPSDDTEISSIKTDCEVRSLAFDWQSQRIAAGGRQCGVSIWQISGARDDKFVLPNTGRTLDLSLSFSRDGRHLLVANENGISSYEIATPTHAVRLRTGTVSSVALSPDNQRFATVDNDGVKVWSTTVPNKEPLQIEHPMINIDSNSLVTAFREDGSLVTADDYSVRIWDLTGRKPLQIGNVTLQDGSRPDTAHPVLSPNGAFVARTVDFPIKDVGTTIWPLKTEALITTACGRLSRLLSRAEWRDAFGLETYRETCPGLKLSAPDDDQ